MTIAVNARCIRGLPYGSVLYVSATVHPQHPLHRTFRRWVDPAPDYDLGRALKSVGSWIRPYLAPQVIDGTQQTLPTDLSPYRGVIVGCSLHYVNPDREPIAPWQQRIINFIKRAVFDYNLPFLGLCGGGQLGLTALGGRVGPNPVGSGLAPQQAGSLVVGTSEVTLTAAGRADAIFKGCPNKLPMVAIHSDYLAHAPASAGFVPLAHSDTIPNQVVAWGERVRLFGIHPEMSSGFVQQMAKHVVETRAFGPYPRARLYAAVAAMKDTTATTTTVFGNFLREFCARPQPDPSQPRRRKPRTAPSHPPQKLFPRELVPLLSHPQVSTSPEHVQEELCIRQLQSYLHFTAHLEQGPVQHVPLALAKGQLLPWLTSAQRQQALAIGKEETEHARSHRAAIAYVRTATGVDVPQRRPAFLARLAHLRSNAPGCIRRWVDLLFVIVSETLITKNLTYLRRAAGLRPWVRHFAARHARDEARHNAFFRRLFAAWWQRLSPTDRCLLGSLLPQLLRAYLAPAAADLAAQLAGYPRLFTNPERIARQVCAAPAVHHTMRAAAASTIGMCRRAGMFNNNPVVLAFRRAGLLEASS